jgi:hypothetical protein
MTTLTIQTQKGTRHLINVQGGVITSTDNPNEAKQFATKAEAVQFSKDNNILAWRATTHE